MADTTGTSAYIPSSRTSVVLACLAVVSFAVSLTAVVHLQSLARNQEQQLAQLAVVQAALTQLERHAERAGIGVAPAFEDIRRAGREGGEAMTRLEQGGTDLPALGAALAEELASLSARWTQAHAAAVRLVAEQPAQTATIDAARTIVEGAAMAGARYEALIERLDTRGASLPLALASRQLARLERLTHAAGLVTVPGAAERRVVEILETQSADFAADHAGLLQMLGADAQLAPLLREAGAAFEPLQAAAQTIAAQAAGMQAMHAAAAELGEAAAAAAPAAEALASAIVRHGEPAWGQLVIFGSGGLGVLLLVASLYSSVRNARRAQAYAEARDSRQQAAILSLLDEITNLADGDLTVDVTVTEDFTGAIADSINYTVDTLRRLVGTINDTSVDIAAAAASTQDTAQRMSQASDRQTREINSVATVITQTSQSLSKVAARAEELAQQATSSVQIAHNGAATVGRTIQGMAMLREQIQETAKRIKRLGESSQEIGNIIEFINDIAEQTNTLALNASIQAAMAGDAGRGFAVVAEEVQRLAERVANATRQVETLVKTIQADTNEAIISMERSTSNVVSGAKSAEEAGQALTKIESSSTELARMIQEISLDARNQSAQAAKIAGQTQIIREIAVQTSSAAGQTAQAVGELTNLSEKLRESVAGFKLPSETRPPGGIELQSAA